MTESTNISELALRFINQTNRSIFLTGKAGTVQSTLLKKIIQKKQKKEVILAHNGRAD